MHQVILTEGNDVTYNGSARIATVGNSRNVSLKKTSSNVVNYHLPTSSSSQSNRSSSLSQTPTSAQPNMQRRTFNKIINPYSQQQLLDYTSVYGNNQLDHQKNQYIHQQSLHQQQQQQQLHSNYASPQIASLMSIYKPLSCNSNNNTSNKSKSVKRRMISTNHSAMGKRLQTDGCCDDDDSRGVSPLGMGSQQNPNFLRTSYQQQLHPPNSVIQNQIQNNLLSKRNSIQHRKVHSSFDQDRRQTLHSSKVYAKQSENLPQALMQSIDQTRTYTNNQNAYHHPAMYSNVHQQQQHPHHDLANVFAAKANPRRSAMEDRVRTMQDEDFDTTLTPNEFSYIQSASLSPQRIPSQKIQFAQHQQSISNNNQKGEINSHINRQPTFLDGHQQQQQAIHSMINQQQQQQNIINHIQNITIKNQNINYNLLHSSAAESASVSANLSTVSTRSDARKYLVSSQGNKTSGSRSINQSQAQTRASSPTMKSGVISTTNTGTIKLKAKVKVQRNNFLQKQSQQQSQLNSTIKNTTGGQKDIMQSVDAQMSGSKKNSQQQVISNLPEQTNDFQVIKHLKSGSVRAGYQSSKNQQQLQNAQRGQSEHQSTLEEDISQKQRYPRNNLPPSPGDFEKKANYLQAKKHSIADEVAERVYTTQERTRQASYDHMQQQQGKRGSIGTTGNAQFNSEYYQFLQNQRNNVSRNQSGLSTPASIDEKAPQKKVKVLLSSEILAQQQHLRQARSINHTHEDQEEIHEEEAVEAEMKGLNKGKEMKSEQAKQVVQKQNRVPLQEQTPNNAAPQTTSQKEEEEQKPPTNLRQKWDLSEEEWNNYGDRFPKTLNKQKLLGRGGFALVWLGQNKQTNELYAIKQIQSKNAHQTHIKEIWFGSFFFKNGQPKEKYQMYRGINNLSKMMLYDIRPVDTWIYYELCGQSLGSSLYELKGEGYKGEERIYRVHYKKLYDAFKKDLKEFKKLIFELAHALWLLSDNRIVHSDLKTENILVTTKDVGNSTVVDQVKLIDYGSSFTFGNLKHFSMATPEYMAPEILNFILYQNQMRHLPELLDFLRNYQKTYVIDIWSLGCVIMEIISGIPLWMSLKTIVTHQGQDIIRHGLFAAKGRVFEKIIEKQIDVVNNLDEFIDEHNYSGLVVDDDIRYLVKKMLELDPTKRISPKEVCKFLQKTILGTEFVDVSPATEEQTEQKAPSLLATNQAKQDGDFTNK